MLRCAGRGRGHEVDLNPSELDSSKILMLPLCACADVLGEDEDLKVDLNPSELDSSNILMMCYESMRT
jgi:hypothetical protein